MPFCSVQGSRSAKAKSTSFVEQAVPWQGEIIAYSNEITGQNYVTITTIGLNTIIQFCYGSNGPNRPSHIVERLSSTVPVPQKTRNS